jgi:hypothetical protein
MCKYAELTPIFEAMAERAKVSDTPWDIIQYWSINEWTTCKQMPLFSLDMKFRVKPETIRIGGQEVTIPVYDLKTCGTKYWYVNLDSYSTIGCDCYHASPTDHARLRHGIVRYTEKEARDLALALLEVLNG